MSDELQTTRHASLIHQLDDIPVHKMPGGEVKVLAGDQVQALWANFEAGTHIPSHSHPNEQITWLRKGRFDYKFGTGETDLVLEKVTERFDQLQVHVLRESADVVV